MLEVNSDSFIHEINLKFNGTNSPVVDDAPSYELNLSKYTKKISAVLKPQNRAQLIEIVALANKHRISLYPLSLGGNWAFGSRLPVATGSVILDLSLLNKMSEYDGVLGTIRLEPGVSQGELGAYLQKQRSAFFVDVTGSGYHTSIIGNALERGIAYNSLRTECILDLEILLGTGQIIRTGYGAFADPSPRGIYRYGLGPSLDQLFFQSNFGIVLSATYQLHPIPENKTSIQIKFARKNLEPVIEAFRQLRQDGVIDCIVHAADPVRSATTICPLLSQKSAEKVWQQSLQSNEWSAIASVYGSKKMVRIKLQEIKKTLRGHAKVIAFDEKKLQWIKKIFSILGMKEQVEFLEASAGLRGLVRGQATSDALLMTSYRGGHHGSQSLNWQKTNRENHRVAVDESPLGVLFCVPLFGYTGTNANTVYDLVQKISKESGLMMGVTLNGMSEKLLEAVISIHFDESTKIQAHQTLRDLNGALIQKGFYPYRLNPDTMDIMKGREDSYKSILHSLKKLFDPQGILSAGRYE